MSNALSIQIIPGDKAPRYDTGYEIQVSRATITEQATQAGLPIVDLIGHDKDGNQVLVVLTGRMVCALAATVRGINERIHGDPEP